MRRCVCLRAHTNPYIPRRWFRRLFPARNSARLHATRALFSLQSARRITGQFARIILTALCRPESIFSLRFRKTHIAPRAVFRRHRPNPTIESPAGRVFRRRMRAPAPNLFRQTAWRGVPNHAGSPTLAQANPPFWSPATIRHNCDNPRASPAPVRFPACGR